MCAKPYIPFAHTRLGIRRQRSSRPHSMAATVDARASTARALGAIGLCALVASVVTYTRRLTGPFKASAAVTWLTLGPSAVLIGMDDARVERAVVRAERARGGETRVREVRKGSVDAVRAILGTKGGD